MATAETVARRRETRWILATTSWYAGWRCCSKCGTFAYCAGRTYEAQRCRSCATGKGGW